MNVFDSLKVDIDELPYGGKWLESEILI